MPTRDDIRDVIDARMFTLLGSAYTPHRAAIKAGLADAVATGIVAWPGSGGGSSVHTDTVNPDENADSDAGYSVGSTWINTATPEEFVCVDDTVGAAVWLSTTDGLGTAAVAVIAAAAVAAHVGAADPHVQYAKEADLATVATTGAFSDLAGIPAAVASLSGTNTGDQTITLTGDVTGSGTGSFAAALASIGSAATKGDATKIPTVTIDAKGRVTGLTESTVTPAWADITGAPISYQSISMTASTSVTVPTAATWCRIRIIAGGGSSASGRRGSAGTYRAGGSGGTGGGVSDKYYSAAALRAVAATIVVTGTATLPAGGASVTSDSTNGNPGTAWASDPAVTSGGTTILTAQSGSPGVGGTNSGTTAQVAAPTGRSYFVAGYGGEPAGGSVAQEGQPGGPAPVGGGGGGGGGGIGAANVRRNGGNGGAGAAADTGTTSGGAGGASDGAAGAGGTAPTIVAAGPGAGGGAASAAGAGGAGAAGVGYGSGAGGGAGSINGQASGAGASGGPWIVEIWFG